MNNISDAKRDWELEDLAHCLSTSVSKGPTTFSNMNAFGEAVIALVRGAASPCSAAKDTATAVPVLSNYELSAQ